MCMNEITSFLPIIKSLKSLISDILSVKSFLQPNILTPVEPKILQFLILNFWLVLSGYNIYLTEQLKYLIVYQRFWRRLLVRNQFLF